MTTRDEYVAKIVAAIADIDELDDSMFYVKHFDIAESGEVLQVMEWHDDEYVATVLDLHDAMQHDDCAECGTSWS